MDPVDLPLSLSNCTLIDVMDTAEQLAIMDRNEKSSTEKEKSSSKFKSTSSTFLTSLKSSLLSKSKKSSSDEYTEPTVVITEQPTKNDSRFRYSSEGKTAGIIKGANNNFPSIKVHGFKGKAKVLVSCVSAVGASGSKDEGADDYFVHPHLLVGNYTDPYHKYQDPGVKKLKDSGVIKALLDKNMTFKLKNVGIQCIKKCDRESILRIRKEMKVDPFNQGFGHVETCRTMTDISTVRICFQVFIYDKHNKETPLDPVVTEPIVDKKAAPDLEISLISELFPPMKGEKEIMIFTSKIDKNDIEVVLQKVEGSSEGAPIRIKPNKVHYGFGLSFKTPESIMANTETPVKFNLYLQRPKSGGRSQPVELTYLPDGCKPVLPKKDDGRKGTLSKKLKRSVETMKTNFSRKKRITTYNEKKGFEDEASDVEKIPINTFPKKDEEGHGKPRAAKNPQAQDLQAKIHDQHLMILPGCHSNPRIDTTSNNQCVNITHLENQYASHQSNVYPIKGQHSSNHTVTIEYQPIHSPRSDQQLPPFDVFGPNFNNGSSDGSQYCFTSPMEDQTILEPTLDDSPDEDNLSRILRTLTSMEENETFNATNSPAVTTDNVSPVHQGSVSQVTKKYVILEKVADENNLDYEPQIKPLNFDQQKPTATTNQQNHTIPITYHLVEAPLQIHANSQMYLTENNFCFGSNEQQLVSSNRNFEFYQAPVSRLSLPPLTPISTGAAQHQTNHSNQSQEVGCSPLGQRSNDSELMATGTVTYPCYVEYDSNQMFYDTSASATNAFGQMSPDDYQRDIPRDILSPQGQCDSSVSSESEDSMQSTNIPTTTWTKYLDGPGLQTKDQGNSRPCKNSRVNRSVSSESENSIKIINIEPRKRQNESSLRNKLRVKHPSGKSGKQTGGIRLRISRRGKSSANFSVKLQLGKKDAAIDEKLSGDLQKMSMDENN